MNEPEVPTVKVFNNTDVDSSQIVACVPRCKPFAVTVIVVPASELSLESSSDDELAGGATVVVVGFVDDDPGKVEVEVVELEVEVVVLDVVVVVVVVGVFSLLGLRIRIGYPLFFAPSITHLVEKSHPASVYVG